MSTNTTLDDQSSSIIYVGSWDGIEHKGDTQVAKYANGTFHASDTLGDTLTFAWEGSRIWLYGAKRGNHGFFSIQLDGADKQYRRGFSQDDAFEQIIWSSGDLNDGPHEVRLTNERGYGQSDTALAWVDLDYIVVEADPSQFGDDDLLTAPFTTSASDTLITTGQPRIQMFMPTGTPEIKNISAATRLGAGSLRNGVGECMIGIWLVLFWHLQR